MTKRTLVFGASLKQERYSNRAIHALLAKGHEVVAVGGREGEVAGVTVERGSPQLEAIDTITMYMGAARQTDHYEYLLGLKPRRIIFNPGAENPELVKLANERGIVTEEACTLVMLSVGNY